MSLAVAGMGWVTPLGSGVDGVWQRLLAGEVATAEKVASATGDRGYLAFRVPASATANAPAHPRLRRSSAISRFAVVAGLGALEDAGCATTPEIAERTALIFAVSNGGVIYTKRFYHEVVESGAQAASPLLFPETVFNAPASHLAAILGITGASYTLVGDGAVGLLAMKMAEDLMNDPAVERCLVVGAEEADWLLCDAYHRWRLVRDAPPVEPFSAHPRGTILSEGAGAVLLERNGRGSARGNPSIFIDATDPGCNFSRQADAARCVAGVFERLAAPNAGLIVASANGTFVDRAEAAAITSHCPDAITYPPKASLGESVGAGSIWQVICAAQALRTGDIPPVPHPPKSAAVPLREARSRLSGGRAIVSACGLNQQVAGVSLQRNA